MDVDVYSYGVMMDGWIHGYGEGGSSLFVCLFVHLFLCIYFFAFRYDNTIVWECGREGGREGGRD